MDESRSHQLLGVPWVIVRFMNFPTKTLLLERVYVMQYIRGRAFFFSLPSSQGPKFWIKLNHIALELIQRQSERYSSQFGMPTNIFRTTMPACLHREWNLSWSHRDSKQEHQAWPSKWFDLKEIRTFGFTIKRRRCEPNSTECEMKKRAERR